MRIAFIIRSLDYGGAERQLVTLATGLCRRGHYVSVTVFYPGGPLTGELEKVGVSVYSADKGGRWDVFGFLRRLVKIIRTEQPDIVHSYLTVSNIFASLLRWFWKPAKTVWGVRASDMDMTQYDNLWRIADWIEEAVARFADMIIVNSQAGISRCMDRGFPHGKLVLIPNGIDTERFTDGGVNFELRRKWSIGDEDTVIGMVARFDPMKDHTTFLDAAAILLEELPDIRFVLVGEGPNSYMDNIKQYVRSAGIEHAVVFAGTHDEMPEVYRAFDLMTLTSAYGEGFPNVVGEAMACGISCVVTDVGDAVLLVGDTGLVVPRSDPKALAMAWRKSLFQSAVERQRAGDRARSRIDTTYSVAIMIENAERTLAMKLAPPSNRQSKS